MINKFKTFMVKQCEEIRIYKWIESEKAGYDLGKIAELEWIRKNAKLFRENFESKEQ
jgi:hypothetical protein